jgi:NhaP-type Na+/H+ or K+/H+ antiporter
MHEDLLIALTGLIGVAVLAHWISWRLRIPSILLFLAFGFLIGPVFQLIDVDHLMGELLFPIVSLAIAIILFEGGLTLRFADLRQIETVVWRILSLGMVVTWALTTLLASLLLGFSFQMALLIGAILVVTGPTVIIPLLRQVRPTQRVGSILRWEGILIDPIGVVLTVLVFEAISTVGPVAGIGVMALGLLKTAVIGLVIGYLAARLLIEGLRRHWIPEYLDNPITLFLVLTAFAISNVLQTESGLLTVTVMGVVLANQELRVFRGMHLGGNRVPVSIDRIVEFKETLQTLIVSTLFIMLAARLQREDIAQIGIGAVVFVLALIVLVRPVMIWLCTLRSPLSWQERVFMGWMAPRGIVAAATASIFGIELTAMNVEGAAQLTPIVFAVIIGTVVIYGLTAGPVAQRLGLAQPNPQGTLIIGAHPWARKIAEALNKAGFYVLLVDTNWNNVTEARLEGLNVVYGNALSSQTNDLLDLTGIGRVLALTSNDEVNALVSLKYDSLFERANVYMLPPPRGEGEPLGIARDMGGRLLFDEKATFRAMSEAFDNGRELKITELTPEFSTMDYQEVYNGEAQVLFAVDRAHKLLVDTVDAPLKPQEGMSVISLVPAEEG